MHDVLHIIYYDVWPTRAQYTKEKLDGFIHPNTYMHKVLFIVHGESYTRGFFFLLNKDLMQLIALVYPHPQVNYH